MKFYASGGSPFVRKCMVVAHERGIVNRLTVVDTQPRTSEELHGITPLRKIPALVLDDGTWLVDSPVIAEYLDQVPGAPSLFPASGKVKWRALQLQGLADGMNEAAVLWRQEFMFREENERSPSWIAKQKAIVGRTMDYFAGEVGEFGDRVDIGTLCVGIAIAYVMFRFPDEAPWLKARPKLAAWFERFTDRPSFHATRPVA